MQENNKTEVISVTLSHYAIEVLIRESSKRGTDISDVIEVWAANQELKFNKKGKRNDLIKRCG